MAEVALGTNEPTTEQLYRELLDSLMESHASKSDATKSHTAKEAKLDELNAEHGLLKLPPESKASLSTKLEHHKVKVSRRISEKLDEDAAGEFLAKCNLDQRIYIAPALRIESRITKTESVLGESTETDLVYVYNHKACLQLAPEWQARLSDFVTRKPGKIGYSVEAIEEVEEA